MKSVTNNWQCVGDTRESFTWAGFDDVGQGVGHLMIARKKQITNQGRQ